MVAQRLARTICPDCRTTYIPDRMLLKTAGWGENAPRVFYRGAGCKKCHDSGFKGRMGIYEVLEMDEKLYSLVYHGADEEQIREYLVQTHGFRSLRDEGLMLVEAGRSTLEEVLRVTHMETEESVRAERKEVAVAATA
jgi:type II secretory ATPase GspE/PulE/Tfp pilus assembly ATPase PilB-like protein